MTVEWHLKSLLEKHGIYNARQLHRALEERAAVSISHQSLHGLMHNRPKQIRLTTAQHLCNFLGVTLSQILIVQPEPIIYPADSVIKPYGLQVVEPPITNPDDYL